MPDTLIKVDLSKSAYDTTSSWHPDIRSGCSRRDLSNADRPALIKKDRTIRQIDVADRAMLFCAASDRPFNRRRTPDRFVRGVDLLDVVGRFRKIDLDQSICIASSPFTDVRLRFRRTNISRSARHRRRRACRPTISPFSITSTRSAMSSAKLKTARRPRSTARARRESASKVRAISLMIEGWMPRSAHQQQHFWLVASARAIASCCCCPRRDCRRGGSSFQKHRKQLIDAAGTSVSPETTSPVSIFPARHGGEDHAALRHIGEALGDTFIARQLAEFGASIVTEPLLVGKMPISDFISVVLPMPLRPMIATISLARRRR